MGVFTDYTRFQRAKNFINTYHNRIYFAFSFGNPEWSPNSTTPLIAPYSLDKFLEQSAGGDPNFALNVYGGSGFSQMSEDDLRSVYGTCPPFPVWNPSFEPTGPTSVGDTEFFTSRQANLSPLGLIAIAKANLHYVNDVTDSPESGSYSFSYGGRLWSYIDSEQKAEQSLCNSILLEATIRAGQIVTNIVEDGLLIIRQVSVLSFEPTAADPNGNSGLSDFMIPASSVNLGNSVVGSVSFKEFNFNLPKSATDTGTSINPIGMKGVHVMINDYLVSSPRQANQQDRYGYVIGF